MTERPQDALVERINFDQPHPGRVVNSTHNGSVIPRGERAHSSRPGRAASGFVEPTARREARPSKPIGGHPPSRSYGATGRPMLQE
jgi:hypothetical protein